MTAHRFFAFLLAVTLAFAMLSPALAEEAAESEATEAPATAQDDTLTDAQRLVRGYDADLGYIYINYGRYPYEADGTVAPILWRVLGIDEDGYALLLTEYVIDFAMYHEKKVTIEEWKGNTIYHTLNDEMRKVMFTDEELSAVLYTDEKGWLYYLDNEDYRNTAYGFRHWQLKPQKERECKPTPYAMTHPHAWKDRSNGCTWYFSTGVPRRGFHNLIGYDGHTSTAANNRYGGVRCACKLDLSKLDHVSGEGTLENPYTFEVIE